VPVEGLEPTRF